MNVVGWILVIFISIISLSKGKKQKRILVNDVDVLNDRITQLEQKMAQLVSVNQNAGHGSTYVRWGRTSCKDSKTELVYSGYTAAQYYLHTSFSARWGGPANTLCLPDDPQLSNETFPHTESLIRGTEFNSNAFASNSKDEDVPCAVCRNPSTTSSIMIPGRQTCYTGWALEYQGYVASGHVGETASEYICVDKNPEYIPSGKADINGRLLYMTGIKCGPLPCPPYDDNRKLPCVVCSK